MYTDQEVVENVNRLRRAKERENEIIEFKEANTNFRFNDLGEYFSALSNEANLRDKEEAWLIFGVKNNGDIQGTVYRKDGGLQDLKKEIAERTNDRMTFLEIYELEIEGRRVVAFQIPPAIRGVPTTWNGAPFAREHESLCPMPLNKLDMIRSQRGFDWSKELVPDAGIEDLDPEAIQEVKKQFSKKERISEEMMAEMSDVDLLNKAGILIKGKVTNTALILLGKKESSYLFDGFIPRITWTLYNADQSVKAYEHFDMPFLLAVDRVYSKIRNEKYRYIADQQTLFPDEVDQYSPDVVKEIINNCIAHTDYRLRGKINVEEYEDRLVFMNEGSFIPETIERALQRGYKPPYYRNTFLCNAMVNLYMIDTNGIGIPMIYRVQRNRCFPLPTYDLEVPNRVRVTLYGRILNSNYTKLLHMNGDLDLDTVFLLDKVQKKERISKEASKQLKKRGLVEGRYPNIYVSFEIASKVGTKTDYVKNKGVENDVCCNMILNALKQMGRANKTELLDVVREALSAVLDEEQKAKRVSYLLQKMKQEGTIQSDGNGRGAYWTLSKK